MQHARASKLTKHGARRHDDRLEVRTEGSPARYGRLPPSSRTQRISASMLARSTTPRVRPVLSPTQSSACTRIRNSPMSGIASAWSCCGASTKGVSPQASNTGTDEEERQLTEAFSHLELGDAVDPAIATGKRRTPQPASIETWKVSRCEAEEQRIEHVDSCAVLKGATDNTPQSEDAACQATQRSPSRRTEEAQERYDKEERDARRWRDINGRVPVRKKSARLAAGSTHRWVLLRNTFDTP